MQFDEAITELRNLDFAGRIAKATELLFAGGWDPEQRARIAYFKAHAQKHLGFLEDALATCADALAFEMPENRRMAFLVCQGLCQYEIGCFAGLQSTSEQLGSMPMTPDIRAYWLMFRGRLLLRSRDPDGLEMFVQAESIFAASDDQSKDWAQAWAQLSQARLAFLLGEYRTAQEAVGRVRYQPYLPKALLVMSEVAAAEGSVDKAETLVNRASEVNPSGLAEADDRARAKYILAVCRILVGDYICGAILMNEAGTIARSAQRVDLELIDAINALRDRVMVH